MMRQCTSSLRMRWKGERESKRLALFLQRRKEKEKEVGVSVAYTIFYIFIIKHGKEGKEKRLPFLYYWKREREGGVEEAG